MIHSALPALSLAAGLALAACSPPMTAAAGFEDEIAAALGSPAAPLASGLYRITGITDETGAIRPYARLLAEAEAADPPEPMPLPEYFTLQWQPASQSYAMMMSYARIYATDGPFQLLEYGAPDETLYLPLEVSDDGARAAVLVYACVDIPRDFREAHDIGTDCTVDSAETVRAALALIDPSDTVRLELAFAQSLPDLGQ
jgi:hypothetical protein